MWDSGHSITELSHWQTLGQHIHEMVGNKKVTGGMVIKQLFGNYWYAWFVSFYLISMFHNESVFREFLIDTKTKFNYEYFLF